MDWMESAVQRSSLGKGKVLKALTHAPPKTGGTRVRKGRSIVVCALIVNANAEVQKGAVITSDCISARADMIDYFDEAPPEGWIAVVEEKSRAKRDVSASITVQAERRGITLRLTAHVI